MKRETKATPNLKYRNYNRKKMEEETIKTGNIYYPPGGILIWFIIILELFTFLGAALVFLHYRKTMLEEFTLSKEMLTPLIGTINTIVLITSGYFMAISVNKLRENNTKKSALFLLSTKR